MTHDEKQRRAIRRFNENVTYDCGCLLWTGRTTPNGRHGIMSAFGETFLAHQFAWLLAKGPWKRGERFGHTCGNTLCVNVDHLICGNPTEVSRATRNKGMTPDKARRLREDERPIEEVAEDFGISVGYARSIKRGDVYNG